MNVRFWYRTQTASTTSADGSHGVDEPYASAATPKAQKPPQAGAKPHSASLNAAALAALLNRKV
eukprot:1173802-Prymnesium_polylepis.2